MPRDTCPSLPPSSLADPTFTANVSMVLQVDGQGSAIGGRRLSRVLFRCHSAPVLARPAIRRDRTRAARARSAIGWRAIRTETTVQSGKMKRGHCSDWRNGGAPAPARPAGMAFATRHRARAFAGSLSAARNKPFEQPRRPP